MSSYLELAKKATAKAPSHPEDLADRRRRRLETAARIGQVNRWCRHHPACIEAHDPTSAEWHHLPMKSCAEWVIKEANKHQKKGEVTDEHYGGTTARAEPLWRVPQVGRNGGNLNVGRDHEGRAELVVCPRAVVGPGSALCYDFRASLTS